MNDHSSILITIGGLLLLGLVADVIGKRSPLPRVTLLVILGYVIGPEVLDLLPVVIEESFDLLAKMALLMVGFLMGGQFTRRTLRRHGPEILWVSVSVVVLTAAIVGVALFLAGIPLEIAVLFAGIATATDPAATTDVVREERGEGPFSKTLLGVVAIDDAWGVILFSLCLSVAVGITGGTTEYSSPLGTAIYEVGGAILLGTALGLPGAWLTGRIERGEPSLTEALGLVFLCGGLAVWLEVSWLLSSITMGTVVVNVARHHHRPFHEIENIEWPFMVLFFVLAGASLRVSALSGAKTVAVAFVLARVVGRFVGGWVGAKLAHSDAATRHWIGLSMMPQAGVALGMALVASERIPGARQNVLPVVIATTVVFELFGPVCTRIALRHAEHANPGSSVSKANGEP